MGVDYVLACQPCQEYLNLGKFFIHEAASDVLLNASFPTATYPAQPADAPYPFIWLGNNYWGILLTAQEITTGLAGDWPAAWHAGGMISAVQEFARCHSHHTMFLSCDVLDPTAAPWSIYGGRTDFVAWKEAPGPNYHQPYLPRNLVEVAGITEWPVALHQLELMGPGPHNDWPPEMLAAIRRTFDALCLARHAPSTHNLLE